jgi:hypothetical protein
MGVATEAEEVVEEIMVAAELTEDDSFKPA